MCTTEYVFNLEPMGAVRMTQSDRWRKNSKQRPEVARYFAYREQLAYLANLQGYKIGDRLAIVFYISMPSSWSTKKKDTMKNTPHQVKPDLDNLIKAFCDALSLNDAHIHDIHARKYWGEAGYIYVTNKEGDEERNYRSMQ